MGRARHEKNTTRSGGAGAIVGTLLLVAAAIGIFLYRDKLTGGNAPAETAAPAVSAGEAYTYETGSQQMFALMGSELAIASTTGLQILDEDGQSVLREVFSMTRPAVCACDDCCIFYDVGGTHIRVVKNGKSTSLDRESPITSVSVNRDGYIAVSGEEDGYKGSVRVYNNKLEAIYEWFSGSGYTLDAAVSPDCSKLTVLTLGSSGSEVHIFRLDSEKEAATIKLDGELAVRLHYSKNGDFCVLTQKNLYFYNDSGKALNRFSFDSNTLEDYEFGTDLTVVALGQYVSGGSTVLTSLGPDGRTLGTATLSEAPQALASQGRKLLVLSNETVTVFDSTLRTQKSAAVGSGYVSAVLLPDDDVMLLSTHYGEKCTPKSR
ncbi:MAG: DUF5711 family protein [Oscillospiraceae bacterium]|jgi:hypothetical protein